MQGADGGGIATFARSFDASDVIKSPWKKSKVAKLRSGIHEGLLSDKRVG